MPQPAEKIYILYYEHEMMAKKAILFRPHAHLLGLPRQHSVASERPSMSKDSHAEDGRHGSHGSYTLPDPGRSLNHNH